MLLEQVIAIYTRFAPHKVSKVTGLLARYAGNEDKLLRLVRRKYVEAGTYLAEGGYLHSAWSVRFKLSKTWNYCSRASPRVATVIVAPPIIVIFLCDRR